MSDSYDEEQNEESSYSEDSEDNLEIERPQQSMEAPKQMSVPILAPHFASGPTHQMEPTQQESTIQENVHPFSNL
jgi:hypothetical protein